MKKNTYNVGHILLLVHSNCIQFLRPIGPRFHQTNNYRHWETDCNGLAIHTLAIDPVDLAPTEIKILEISLKKRLIQNLLLEYCLAVAALLEVELLVAALIDGKLIVDCIVHRHCFPQNCFDCPD